MHTLPQAEEVAPKAEALRDEGRALLSYLAKVEKCPTVKWLAAATGHSSTSGTYKRLDSQEEGTPGVEDFYAASRACPENRARILDFFGRVFGVQWHDPASDGGKQDSIDSRSNLVIQKAAELIAAISVARADKTWSRDELLSVTTLLAQLDYVARPLRADMSASVDAALGGQNR